MTILVPTLVHSLTDAREAYRSLPADGAALVAEVAFLVAVSAEHDASLYSLTEDANVMFLATFGHHCPSLSAIAGRIAAQLVHGH